MKPLVKNYNQEIKLNQSLQKRFWIRPGVAFWQENKKYFITDYVTLKFKITNKIGYEILKMLNGDLTLAEIVRKICKDNNDNGANESKITYDILEFINQLRQQHLITAEDLKEIFQKYYRPLHEAHLKQYGFPFKPGLLYWEVTNACNYRCLMCYNFSGQARQRELTAEEGLEALAKLKKAGVLTIIFTGGEPLVRKEKLFIWLKKANDLGISTELFTNGSLIDRATALNLKKNGLNYCRVTIHGSSAKTQDKISQIEGSYDKSISGLKEIIRVGIPTNWQMTCNRYNFKELRLVLEKAITMGCHAFRAGSLDLMGKGENQKDIALSPAQEVVLWKFLDDAIVAFGDKIKIGWGGDICMEEAWKYYVTNPTPPAASDNQDPNIYMRYAKNSLCGVGVRSMGMTAAGDIIPCPALADLKMGNVRDEDPARIWQRGEYFRPFREKMLEDYDSCKSCGQRYVCVGGCRAIAYHRTGDLSGGDLRRCFALKKMNSLKKEPYSFFAPKELNVDKYPLNKNATKEKIYYGPFTEGTGPWIPYQAVLIRKKIQMLRKEKRRS